MSGTDLKLVKASSAFNGDAKTNGFDFRVLGDQTPFLEISMDPGLTIVAESGALLSKSGDVKIDTQFGDGVNEGGFFKKLGSAAKRLVTGESLLMTTFNNEAQDRRTLTLAAPIPGEIFALNLADLDNEIICQRGSFFAAPKGVDINIHLNKKLGSGFFGGEGFIMQKLTGDDWVFLNAGGNLYEHMLKDGEQLDVDTSCLVAITKDVQMDITSVGAKNFLFGGEGLFLSRLTGPGKVWVQSMPFARLTDTIGNALRPMMRSEARSATPSR